MPALVRRLLRLAIVLAIAGGLYYLGGKYLWPPRNPNVIETVGIIEAPEVNITSRIAGRIVELNLLEGDTVERGQVVFKIEDIDIRNQLANARGNLANAQAALHNDQLEAARMQTLFDRKVVSAAQRDDAVAKFGESRGAVIAAQGQVQLYSDQLADTVVRAPISGVVVSKNLEIGEWVTPGTSVLTVDDLSTIWARIDLEETDLGWIRIGTPAQVMLPTRPPLTYTGRVMAIGQEGQFATETDVRRGRQDIRTFYLKVRVLQTSGEVKPGMTAEVTFTRDGNPDGSDTSARTY
ncbi:MAG TPA: efflux RND transporter periplasmic adaptor subunit [Candidatus Binataceae bacterium]|nr:efflux RND transporter periplasmic adaptor subunit [Candidatus Binataceae bacterium]